MRTRQIGECLGVDFEIEVYPSDGFQLKLYGPEGETLFDRRMILYTLYEAVTYAASEVWADEMAEHEDYELPQRIAAALQIPESYSD